MWPFDITGDPNTGGMSPANSNQGFFQNPLVQAGLLQVGGGLLGGLGSLLAGPTESQKKARQVYGLAQQKYGQPVFNPNSVFQDLQYALEPQFQATAQNLSKRLGLSSPLAQAGLAKQRQSALSQLLGNLKLEAIQLQEQRDQSLLGAMLQAAQMS